jgi:hypothetical protein
MFARNILLKKIKPKQNAKKILIDKKYRKEKKKEEIKFNNQLYINMFLTLQVPKQK